jgi:ribonuclease D
LPNYRILKKELINQGKLSWAEEEVQFLLNKDTYEPNYRQILKKTKGINKISHKNQENAFKLIHWRESIAQQKNKPRKWIMSDEKIINYATGNINFSSNEWNQFDSFIKKNKVDFKDLNLIKKPKPLAEHELIRRNELKEQITNLSIEHNLPNELICSSKNLVKFIRGSDSTSLNSGWRSKIFKI